jgi:capsular polysaccharide biosynthesis protein
VNVQGYLQDLVAKVFKRHYGWLIIVAALITAGSALVFSTLQIPFYRSSMPVQVLPARTELGLAQSIQLLLRSYVSVMLTTENAQKVVDALGLMRTPEELKSKVTIEPDDARLVLVFNVDDYDGPQANRIAKQWGLLFLQWRERENQRQEQESRVYAEILEEPRYRQLRPRPLLNTAAGGMFGLVLGTAVAVAIVWLEQGIIRTPKELKDSTPPGSSMLFGDGPALTVVGVVPPPEHYEQRKFPSGVPHQKP